MWTSLGLMSIMMELINSWCSRRFSVIINEFVFLERLFTLLVYSLLSTFTDCGIFEVLMLISVASNDKFWWFGVWLWKFGVDPIEFWLPNPLLCRKNMLSLFKNFRLTWNCSLELLFLYGLGLVLLLLLPSNAVAFLALLSLWRQPYSFLWIL